MNEITIRTVRPDDLTGCHTVEQACFPPDEAADEDGIRTRIERFPQGFLVAERNGMIIGQINSGATHKNDITDEAFKKLVGHCNDGCNVVIFSLSVLPAYQGRGIAASLMREFITEARKQSRKSVLLLCKDDLIDFYERLGFCNRGLSASTHGGARWYEMALPVSASFAGSVARNT
ncbi:GNAT family N-acetyltransferase [Desulfovibrio oxyclinae]|uniref:GNAT family N-acetyltransferase n=1 Tax=Desulfovibrio oxyclinae TaxID=63560 RepID=UPI00036EB00D|nr:GNAT family N-acetyltransferase [Desulfovibrio oxyclinae]